MTGLHQSPGEATGAMGDTPLGRFELYLREHNLRLTQERRSVLDVVLSREGHFDAERLFQFVRRRREGKRVSRATLYRTLDHLRAAGLVKMHRFGPGQALYEHVYNRRHHDHMVCDSCGRVVEFVNDEIERLQEDVCRANGFRSSHHVMQIFGSCAECVATEGEEARR
jgi:Fur family ferric uptake transcriptional regulator